MLWSILSAVVARHFLLPGCVDSRRSGSTVAHWPLLWQMRNLGPQPVIKSSAPHATCSERRANTNIAGPEGRFGSLHTTQTRLTSSAASEARYGATVTATHELFCERLCSAHCMGP